MGEQLKGGKVLKVLLPFMIRILEKKGRKLLDL